MNQACPRACGENEFCDNGSSKATWCFPRTLRLRLSCLVILIALAGCESRPPVTTSDPVACKSVLESALDAWQAGGSVADLKLRTPPVYVADEQWERGSKLQSYRLENDGQVHGTNVQFQVRLTSLDPQGRKSEQVVRYLVTDTPAQTIARESL